MSDTSRNRFVGYNVVDQWQTSSWNDKTREVVGKRLQQVPDRRFFTENEWDILVAVCNRLVPQPDRPDAPVPIVPFRLVPCFTPVESPESNGMAEAFVKTFKRDYVRVSPIPDAATALAAIDSWMEDYNNIHPHSRLGYRSPREYILSQPAPCPV